MMANAVAADDADWQVSVESVPRRSYRLIYYIAAAQATSGMIGVHEFTLLDAQGRNLCRTAGFIPALGYTKQLTQGPWFDPVSHGPDKTIDGNTTNWASTCYGFPNIQRTAFIQYTFQDDFTPTRWTCKVEGNYFPAVGGMQLWRMNGNGIWENVTGSQSAPAEWGSNATKTFTMPAITN